MDWKTEVPPPSYAIRRFLVRCFVLFMGGCCSCVVMLFVPITAHFFLAPFLFLDRVLPNVTVSWTGVLTVCVSLGLLAFGVHRLGGWLYTQAQKKRQVETIRPWRWRWTISLLAVFMLLFVAGMAAVGIVHQSIWVMTSPEPMFYRRPAVLPGNDGPAPQSNESKPSASPTASSFGSRP